MSSLGTHQRIVTLLVLFFFLFSSWWKGNELYPITTVHVAWYAQFWPLFLPWPSTYFVNKPSTKIGNWIGILSFTIYYHISSPIIMLILTLFKLHHYVGILYTIYKQGKKIEHLTSINFKLLNMFKLC